MHNSKDNRPAQAIQGCPINKLPDDLLILVCLFGLGLDSEEKEEEENESVGHMWNDNDEDPTQGNQDEKSDDGRLSNDQGCGDERLTTDRELAKVVSAGQPL